VGGALDDSQSQSHPLPWAMSTSSPAEPLSSSCKVSQVDQMPWKLLLAVPIGMPMVGGATLLWVCVHVCTHLNMCLV
jgi:hypothetical protein